LALVGAVRDAVGMSIPSSRSRSMSWIRRWSRSTAARRLSMTLLTLFAALAVLLALIGIYGITGVHG